MNKIIITGATGFIGSHLAELCVEKGFNVAAFDRYNLNNHWGWLEDSEYKDEIEVILGDHCHIATGAIVNGEVTVGSESFIGSGAVTKQSVFIGNNCVIGTGVVVKRNIESDQVVKN
tara:strand:- start:20 stop:370 length:351 start_codon:yes stop_codon:yes gene_type:complete